MTSSPYIFCAKPITDGAHYSVTIDRNGTITTPHGGRDMPHLDMVKALCAIGEEASMKGRSVQVIGVSAEVLRTAGRLPYGCMSFQVED